MTSNVFAGVFAATLTPYGEDGRVDESRARDLTRRLVADGLAGVCPAGTTGEFPLLSREEKEAVVRAACEGGGRTIAGVWGAAYDERSWLSRKAEETGAAGVFLTVPFYYPAPADHILEWYRGVGRATRLPVFAYNIPQCAANEIPLEVLDRLAREGTISGYKDSSHDPARLEAAVRLLKGRIAVFGGSEALFPMARELGVDGFISGAANAYPRTVVAVWNGDREAARRLSKIKDVTSKAGGIPALKYILGLRGTPVGPAREPIAPLTARAKDELERLEKEFGKER